MQKYFAEGFVFLLGMLSVQCVLASHIPDFYQEPGVNPKRQYSVDLQGVENIDPFTGILRLSYDDLVIPGNGGLDIVVKRTYHVAQQISGIVGVVPYKNGRTVTGMGWDIHFGRIHYNGSLFPNDCGEVNQLSSANPVLELPDGSKKVLFNKLSGSASREYISKDRWTATCIDIANGRYRDGGLLVTSPDGTQYTMNLLVNYRGLAFPEDALNAAWHTTRIEDKNGNWVKIDYIDKATTQYANIDRITSNDGRRVDFTYSNPTTNDALLTRITANGQSWNYSYSAVPNDATGYYFLDKVTGPEGLVWEYDYYASGDGLFSLSRMTMPFGARVDYTYQERVAQEGVVGGVRTTAIKTKKTAGPNVVAGTWSYVFSTASNNLDETTITTPNGKEVFFHCGEKAAFTGRPAGCQTDIGKLLIKEIFNGRTRIQTEQYAWTSVKISDQNENYPTRGYASIGVFTDVLTQKVINRNDAIFDTRYSNFDAYDNPRRIEETSGGDTRRTDYTYYVNTSKWIVKQLEDETLFDTTGRKLINRTFDTKGRLSKVDKYGEETQYTYTAEGDINRVTDPRNKSVRYSRYKRGIPQTEARPESVTIGRTVNDAGTVATETNGRGDKTSYQYDDLNRLTTISPPAGSRTNVAYSWRNRNRTITRGSFSQRSDYDGFGRVIKSSAEGIVVNSSYNALGQKVFESYPNSTKGVRFELDILDRNTRVTNTADNTTVEYIYASNNRVSITDENDLSTVYQYQSYGSPDEKYLISVSQPENINTTMTRTRRGDVLSINQGGLTRRFAYDSRFFLDYIDHPEIGRVDVNYDGNGNIISRSTGSSATTRFTYDGLNRLTSVNYPGATPDVKYTYDGNNNLKSLAKGDTNWAYGYDANDNLTSEKLTLGNRAFDIGYRFNALDALTETTLPNGLVVKYAPNTLGQATQAGGFASGIKYHPNGQINDFQFGNGINQSITQNDRLFIGGISAEGIVNLAYTYDKAGNPKTIKDALDATYDRILSYDGVNRLVTADGAWSGMAFVYNQRGDIVAKRFRDGDLNYNYSASSGLLTGTSGIKAYSFDYDVYGNVIANGFDDFVYDDASNLTDVTSQNTQYTYDGHNRRVAEAVNGQNHYYVYNQSGQLVYEADAFDVKQTSYIRLGSALIAQQDVCLDGDQDLDLIPDCTEVEAGLNPQDASDADKDLDGDGLTNLVEYQLGTSLTNEDTDGDLMSDGFENTFGLDPLTNDADLDLDGDGFSNLDEFQRSSSPIDPRSIPAGETRWSVEINSGVAVVGMASTQEGALYASFQSLTYEEPITPLPGEISSQLAALNVDGSLKWTHDFLAAGRYTISKPVIGLEGSIYIVFTDFSGSDDSSIAPGFNVFGISTLYSVSPLGDINWSVVMGESGIAITPVVGVDGTLYTAADRQVLAYNNAGVLRWNAVLPNSVADSLALSADNTLQVATSRNYTSSSGACFAVTKSSLIDNVNLTEVIDSNLYAINADGSLKWHKQMDRAFHRPPAIGIDGSLYYMTSRLFGNGDFDVQINTLHAISRSGDLLWTKDDMRCGFCTGLSMPVITQDGSLITHGEDTYRLNPDGSTKWRRRGKSDDSDVTLGASSGASPILTNQGELFIGTSKNLILYNTNGDRLWISPLPNIRKMLLSLVGDQLYVNAGSQLRAVATNGAGLSPSPWPMEGRNIAYQAAASACDLTDGDNDGDGMPTCAENSMGLDDNNIADAAADPDADGLNNLQEYQQNTHYFLSDTDFDGLTDGTEVAQLLDPADADMDDDGLTDGYEVANGLDPQLADTHADNDGDGFTNIEEFTASRNPSDPASKPLEDDKLWQLTTTDAFSAGIVFGHDGTLYYSSACGVKAATPRGQLKWIYPAKKDFARFHMMVGPDETIYATSLFQGRSVDRVTPDTFDAINPDGTLKWELDIELGRARAIGVNGTVYSTTVNNDVNSADHTTLLAINPDGSYQWTYVLFDENKEVEYINVGADGSIYAFTNSETIALTVGGEIKWQRPLGLGALRPSPAIGPNGNIYYSLRETLEAVSSETGLLLWSYSHPAYGSLSTPTVGADNVVTVNAKAQSYTKFRDSDALQISGNGDLIGILDDDHRHGTFNKRYYYSINDNGELVAYYTGGLLETGGWPMVAHDLHRTFSLAAGLPPFNNNAPTLILNSPADGATVIEGTPVSFSATATDTLEGDLNDAITWTSSLDGDLGTGATIQVDLSLGSHLITATVIDSDFLTTRVELAVNVTVSADIDADDMLDQWEIDTFGSLDELPTGDFDGDGISNFQEYKIYIMLTFGGDVNQDGASTITDVVLMQQYLLDRATLSTQQILRGDYYPATGDNAITLSDLLILQQRILSGGN